MYCKNCGMQIEDNSDVCPYCEAEQFDNNGNIINKSKIIFEKIQEKTNDGPISIEIGKTKKKFYKKVIEKNIRKVGDAMINKADRNVKIITKKILKIIGK